MHFNFYMNNHWKKNQIRSITQIASPRNRDFYVYIGTISVVIYSCKDPQQVMQNPWGIYWCWSSSWSLIELTGVGALVPPHTVSLYSLTCELSWFFLKARIAPVVSHIFIPDGIISFQMGCMIVHQRKFDFCFLFGSDLHSWKGSLINFLNLNSTYLGGVKM